MEAILDFDEELVIETIKTMKNNGSSTIEIMEICKTAMDKVGKMFQEKEMFLTELIMSGELMTTVMNELGLGDKEGTIFGGDVKGKILIGTVKDDIHDIGKNIVKSILMTNGFEVVDIGVDVPIRKFLDEVMKHKPDVVAMCGLLTVAYDSMKATIEEFEKEGIRNDLKIMVGGGSTDQAVCDYVKADGFGRNAVDALSLAKQWIEG